MRVMIKVVLGTDGRMPPGQRRRTAENGHELSLCVRLSTGVTGALRLIVPIGSLVIMVVRRFAWMCLRRHPLSR